jgi:hypothetical protein
VARSSDLRAAPEAECEHEEAEREGDVRRRQLRAAIVFTPTHGWPTCNVVALAGERVRQ